MGFFRRLFGVKPKAEQGPVNYTPGVVVPSIPGYSDRDVDAIAQSAYRMVDVITESYEIAKTTSNPETKASRVDVALDIIVRLRAMQQQHPFIVLNELPTVEQELLQLKSEAAMNDYAALADGNGKGQALEKEGRVEEALDVYRRLADGGTDTPFTYRRLAILYRKQKDTDAELAALDQACQNVPNSNSNHHAWFVERRDKLRAKLDR